MNALKARVKAMQAECRAGRQRASAAQAKKVRLDVPGLCHIGAHVWFPAKIHDSLGRYFDENPGKDVYIGILDMAGDRHTLNAATDYGRKNKKIIYVFGVDDATGSVVHQNHVPEVVVKSKGLKASVWLAEVSRVIGGKVSFFICGGLQGLLI